MSDVDGWASIPPEGPGIYTRPDALRREAARSKIERDCEAMAWLLSMQMNSIGDVLARQLQANANMIQPRLGDFGFRGMANASAFALLG